MSPKRGSAADAIFRYGPMVYAPTAIYSMGQGAVVPVLPSISTGLGAPLWVAALVAAALPVGQLAGNMPAGVLVGRVGERRAMILASAVSSLGILAMVLAPTIGVLGLAVLVLGACGSVFALARHAFMTARVPLAYRARALSLVGGSFRLGTFTGPLMAAGLIALTGSEHSTIWFFLACAVGVGLLVLFGPDPEAVPADPRPATGAVPVIVPREGLFATTRRHRGVLARLGLAAASLAAVRAGRQAIFPVWGVSIGMDPASIALFVGIAGGAEFALFYASGQIMDRFGRIWASVPSQLLMSASLLVLTFTHDLDAAEVWFAVCVIAVGIGNGLSSGVLLTLGSDVAPRHNTASFLGAWRTMTDGGASLTPVLVSAITAVASIAFASGIVALIGLAGAAAFIRWIPRYSPHSRPDPEAQS
ncbi:MFS transporter [Microbacterium indicum]|uniref:MFS transporter n=1 Tax=Microbacterium indicum TaxID=358100 RepID=UPI00048EE443|nr:MFS transporter [Microbacterium indicum]